MTYIENLNITVQSAPRVDEPDIVMTNSDFIKGYEQAINSREFRATRFFSDTDIVGILSDFMQEPHDEADMQYHAGQITGLIVVRCLTRAYPRETDEQKPLQGHPYAPAAPQANIDAPQYGSLVYSSDWPDGTVDFVLDKTKERGVQLELSLVPPKSADAEPAELMHIKQHDIMALRDFLNQATVTRWLES